MILLDKNIVLTHQGSADSFQILKDFGATLHHYPMIDIVVNSNIKPFNLSNFDYYIFTSKNGVNAFFIRNDFASEITTLLSSVSAYPSMFREARGEDGKLTLISGLDRFKIIKDCKFFNLKTKENINIEKLGKIYSPQWQRGERNNF